LYFFPGINIGAIRQILDKILEGLGHAQLLDGQTNYFLTICTLKYYIKAMAFLGELKLHQIFTGKVLISQ
jgi:hypothetical protein